MSKRRPNHEKANLDRLTVVLPGYDWLAQNDRGSSTKRDESSAKAGTSELQKATEVVEHMSAAAPDRGVPKEVLESAKCVAVIPKLIKGAFRGRRRARHGRSHLPHALQDVERACSVFGFGH